MIVVDTNVAIHLRDGDREIGARLLGRDPIIAIALPTLIELEGGVYAKPELASYRRAALDRLIARVTLLELDRNVVPVYGRIIVSCGFSRSRIIDRLIAATAIVHGLTLITINGPDFREISSLALEIWPAPGQ